MQPLTFAMSLSTGAGFDMMRHFASAAFYKPLV